MVISPSKPSARCRAAASLTQPERACFPSGHEFSSQLSNPGDPTPAASLIDSKPQVFEITDRG
jgi:hypothetical protein